MCIPELCLHELASAYLKGFVDDAESCLVLAEHTELSHIICCDDRYDIGIAFEAGAFSAEAVGAYHIELLALEFGA